MKNNITKFGAILLVTLSMSLASCTKIDTTEPIEITSFITSSPSNDSHHITKIRFCLKNHTENTLYYCRITIADYDDGNEVFRHTYELGSKNNHNWTIAPYETRWSDFYSTDFYIFGEGTYADRIDETLFY